MKFWRTTKVDLVSEQPKTFIIQPLNDAAEMKEALTHLNAWLGKRAVRPVGVLFNEQQIPDRLPDREATYDDPFEIWEFPWTGFGA